MATRDRDVFKVLGVAVDAVQIPEVIARVEGWIEGRGPGRFIAVTGMHGVAEASRDAEFRAVLAAADLVVPDGMPLVWIGRARGHALRRRVYGPELLVEFCRATQGRGYRHFFYGGEPGVADALAKALAGRFPGLGVAGTLSPPFRPLTADEEELVHSRIEDTAPDILWVGMSTPKQEKWMAAQRAHLNVPVMVGVGAAFDLLTGRVRQAPAFMREHGLEWSWRLAQEPRRLWKRYLVHGSRFAFNVTLELTGLRRFN